MRKKEIAATKLGMRIAQHRAAMQITQSELGDLCGIGGAMISHIELGRNKPSMDTAKRLAAALNISLDQLMGD